MLIKNTSSKHILILLTGTTIAQAIPIVISPILTRIYSPQDFGVFAIFLAITTIFGSIASGRYELAIMLPKKDEDAVHLAVLGIAITILLTIFLFILIGCFYTQILTIFDNKEIGAWIYSTPLVIFFIGLFNILNYYNTRKQQYKDLAQATIIKSIVLAIFQILIGFFKLGVFGLIVGQILSHLFGNIALLKNTFYDKTQPIKLKKLKIYAVAKKYKSFPKFSMWSIFANTSSQHLTNLFISSFYTVAALGYYTLVQKILIMPMQIIGGAISQVFFQESSEKYRSHKPLKPLFLTTLKKLFFIGLPIFTILFFAIEDLFAFVFGETWRIAGLYAHIVLPLYFTRFIVSAFTIIPIVFNRASIDLIFQIILLLLSIVIAIVCHQLQTTFEVYLYYHSIILLFFYVIYLYYIYKNFISGQ